MNRAQQAERAGRFKVAFKISLPFIVVIAFLVYTFFNAKIIDDDDIILLTILTLCYVYFATYMIYQSFNDSVLDSVTGTFLREKIVKIFKKKIKKHKNESVVLLNLKNIDDISSRYGLDFGDKILRKMVENLDEFLLKNEIKNSVIGRYSGSYFLIFSPCERKKLGHILGVFAKKFQSIDGVEIKINSAVAGLDFSSDHRVIINHLSNELNGITPKISQNLNDFEKQVCYAIRERNFSFKIQKIASLKGGEDLNYIITSLQTRDFGITSRSKFINIASKNNLGVDLDFEIFKAICAKNLQGKVIIEVASSTLRNTFFIKKVGDFIKQNGTDVSHIIFDFSENDAHVEILRFEEILRHYKSLGFGIALSQFGGKNHSLNHFLNLSLDYIIYDIGFTKKIDEKKFASLIFKFSEICADLGVKSVIKFVENAQIMEVAKQNGVDYAQGFYIQKPKEI